MKIRRPCSHFGCHALTTNRYCDEHTALHAAQLQLSIQQSNREYNKRRPEYHSLYKTEQWKLLRRQQLAIHPWCEECERYGIRTIAEEVHHVIPHKGNSNYFYYGELQSLCKPCHSRKTAQEARYPPRDNV